MTAEYSLRQLRRIKMLKAKEPIYRRLQAYLNKLVDSKVENQSTGMIGDFNKFSEATIFGTVWGINNPDTVRSFQKLINSPYTSNDGLFKKLTRLQADKVTRVISEKETERILKNLRFVEKTLAQAEIDLAKYQKLASNMSTTASRYKILERSLTDGTMYNGRDLSYKELNNLAKDLENYKQNKIDFEEKKAINEESNKEGLDTPYTHKVWEWSQLEHTRHSGMDGTTIPINEKFIVYNEVTGDVDNLDFPGDVENYTNPSNVINCGCGVDYIQKDIDKSEEYKESDRQWRDRWSSSGLDDLELKNLWPYAPPRK